MLTMRCFDLSQLQMPASYPCPALSPPGPEQQNRIRMAIPPAELF
jgi:hypothetical protein